MNEITTEFELELVDNLVRNLAALDKLYDYLNKRNQRKGGDETLETAMEAIGLVNQNIAKLVYPLQDQLYAIENPEQQTNH